MSRLAGKDREKLEMLLPWYVNGTLDRESVARIEAALRSDPELAHSLALLREDRDAVVGLAEADELPASMEARFLAQLDAEPAREARRSTGRAPAPGLLTALGTWIGEVLAAATPRGLALATATAALVVVLQAGVILSMLGAGESPQGGFRTASGEAGQEGGPALLVQFADGADIAGVAAFLDRNGMRIVDGPLPGGMFKLRFAASEQRSGQELVALLRAQPDYFRLVLPSE